MDVPLSSKLVTGCWSKILKASGIQAQHGDDFVQLSRTIERCLQETVHRVSARRAHDQWINVSAACNVQMLASARMSSGFPYLPKMMDTPKWLSVVAKMMIDLFKAEFNSPTSK